MQPSNFLLEVDDGFFSSLLLLLLFFSLRVLQGFLFHIFIAKKSHFLQNMYRRYKSCGDVFLLFFLETAAFSPKKKWVGPGGGVHVELQDNLGRHKEQHETSFLFPRRRQLYRSRRLPLPASKSKIRISQLTIPSFSLFFHSSSH